MTREEILQTAKPILFNTDEVRAIKDGRKTVTRRVIKCPEHKVYNAACAHGKWFETYNPADMPEHLIDWYANEIAKPLYKRGDILYVRETWGFQKCSNCENCANCTNIGFEDIYKDDEGCFVYRTNYGKTEDDSFPPSSHKWHPSIHMPKEAARIFLLVSDVRVERLQDITDEQAYAEGFHDAKEFIEAFLQIYPECKKESWVWVIKFEQIKAQKEKEKCYE